MPAFGVLAILLYLFPTEAFDIQAADRHLFHAYASYCNTTALFKWDCYWCNSTSVNVTTILYNATEDIYGFIGIDRQTNSIVVSIRGTIRDSIANWIENFDFLRIAPYPNLPTVLVHEGFYGSYQSIMGQLAMGLMQTMNICPQCTATWFVGHSLGAAVATIALVDLQYNNILKLPNPQLFTFGEPRTGNYLWASFVSYWTVSSNRVVHGRDPVPHLPFVDMGFQHSPLEIWEYPDGTFNTCNGSGEDPSCSDSLLYLTLADHFVYMGYNHRDGIPYYC